MAEEFTLHQLGRDCAAVHGHERTFLARARFVNQARDELLARTGFTGDMNRRLAARHPVDHVTKPLHRGGLAEEP